MQLNIEVFTKLCSLIDNARKEINYEFEARFWNKDNRIINSDKFTKIFQKFTFSKNNNGLGYKYEMKNILDIISEKNIHNDSEPIRISVHGLDNIKKYWLMSDISNLEASFIEKEKIDKIDEENYNIRFSLNNELPQNNLLNKNKNILLSNSHEKVFRLKNRYSIKTDDGLFLIDMTSVKFGKGRIFKESNTLKENLTYEIEIEYIGKDIKIETEVIAKRLLYHCEIILKILQNTNILLTNSFINIMKKFYNKLVNNKQYDNFIAASPVTIHREHLIKSDDTQNVYRRYAVTLKADGERNFVIVYSSENEEDNGKIFIFNNNFNFVYTGYKDVTWCNTLIEGEFVENGDEREIYMYDILFSKGQDIRRKHLIDIKKDDSNPTRLEILDQFQKSTTRKIHEKFNEKDTIKIKTKKYIQSVRSDGSDIFQKVKELWDNRKYNSFHVDGVIFVPKYEYYPLSGGSWHSLFKWKPEELNTIDFLIKFVKDDNKKDIKSPYIEVIDRPDGKSETVLKQYKSIRLYVTGQKIVYTNNHKSNKKNIPVLFNPFNLDERNSEIHNLVKLFISDDEYMQMTQLQEKEKKYQMILL